MNRSDLQALARIRLSEAQVLLKAGRADGAYYLAGYSVECGLKACIAKTTARHDFPDQQKAKASYTHNLAELVRVAKLDNAKQELVEKDPAFRNNWELVQQWNEHSRYQRHESSVAAALVTAVADRKHGVMVWIKRHW